METHKIDSLIKNALKDSEDFYDSDAIDAKKRVWSQVQTQKQRKPLSLRLLAAASILLFIGMSAIMISNMRYKSTINALVESNTDLEKELLINKQNSITEMEAVAASYSSTPDTIYVEKKIIEVKPLITTKYITDTVYIKQIVYVEKETDANLLTGDETASSPELISKPSEFNYQSEILISSSDAVKKEKGRKFKLKFGGNRSQIRNGTLAVTTKL